MMHIYNNYIYIIRYYKTFTYILQSPTPCKHLHANTHTLPPGQTHIPVDPVNKNKCVYNCEGLIYPYTQKLCSMQNTTKTEPT